MAHPPVDIVDENDLVIGNAMLHDVWQSGDCHRLTRVIVQDKYGRILLQKRTFSVELFPGCWDVSSSGHVDTGEDYYSAARRELVEELGLAAEELEEIGYYKSNEMHRGHKLNRFNKLYLMRWSHTPELFGRDEVSEVRWFTLPEIYELIATRPDLVSDGLRESVEHQLIGNVLDKAVTPAAA
jgi:16S rRNA (adenine1518-N6/adenine1519-N6)-dimethyltransferase